MTLAPRQAAAFRERVYADWRARGRHDLPWRRTTDPYAVLVSEVMLQQTQVTRVVPRYEEWLTEFPTFDALASAPTEAVLRAWSGLGYNRRALALKRAAEVVSAEHGGVLPRDEAALRALPGVGPATAAGVIAFAFGEPARYLETNVRAALIHDFFPGRDDVRDAEILPVLDAVMDRDDPRSWCHALLDYGWALKRSVPNPSRRSAHHARQSRFEGSRRQKRARLLRAVMEAPGMDASGAAGVGVEPAEAAGMLDDLVAEGFLREDGGRYSVAD